MRRFALYLPAVAALLAASTGLCAQNWSNGPCKGDENHGSSWFFGHQEQVCELRRTVLPVMDGKLQVAGKNGGIEVIGEDRSDIALEARVVAQASSHDDAEAMLHQIQIVTNGTIHADGPQVTGWSHRSWSVDYRLHVPRRISAELITENGGIELSNLDGSIHAQSTNGGLSLSGMAGDVHASTVNGGVEVILAGEHWHGDGLYAKSVNGGISVKAPDHYSAHLVAQTVNGGISLDFPVTIHGATHNHIDTSIGEGGPTLDLESVNGGVSIDRD